MANSRQSSHEQIAVVMAMAVGLETDYYLTCPLHKGLSAVSVLLTTFLQMIQDIKMPREIKANILKRIQTSLNSDLGPAHEISFTITQGKVEPVTLTSFTMMKVIDKFPSCVELVSGYRNLLCYIHSCFAISWLNFDVNDYVISSSMQQTMIAIPISWRHVHCGINLQTVWCPWEGAIGNLNCVFYYVIAGIFTFTAQPTVDINEWNLFLSLGLPETPKLVTLLPNVLNRHHILNSKEMYR